jgi:hypothetical protein
MLLLFIRIEEVTAPVFEIKRCVPEVAEVELLIKELLLILRVAHEAEVRIPVNTPVVAVVCVQPVIRLLIMFTALLAAVAPAAFSIGVSAVVVPPDFTVMVLLETVRLALVAVFT